MTPLAGPVHAAALVLLAAGGAKLLRPAGTSAALRTLGLPGSRAGARLLGGTEATVAVAVLAGAGAAAAATASAFHVGFAVVAILLARRSATCGCFGAGSPVTGVHVATSLVVAGLFAAAVVDPVASVAAAVGDTPAAGLPYALLVGLLAAGEVLCLTALPEAQTAARALGSAP